MAARTRIWTYVGIASFLVILDVALELNDWPFGNPQLHTLMEVVATLLALIVGVVALVRYDAKRQNMILFIGVGFVGTAMLDGYHAGVTSTFFHQRFPSALPSLNPWSWNASRIFLAISMFLSWLVWWREEKLDVSGRIREITVCIGALLFMLASLCFVTFVPLGREYSLDFIFGRPEAFVAAAFFGAALVGYLSKQAWRHDVLEHWIVNALIVSFLCQAVIMSRSHALFDGMFNVAHALKIVSYTFVFIGLLAEIQVTWHHEQQLIEQRTTALAESTRELEFAYTAAPGKVKRELIRPRIVRATTVDNVGIESFDDAMDLWARQARAAIGAHQSAVSYIPDGVFKVAKHAVSLSDKYEKYRTYAVLPTGEGIWRLVAKNRQSFCLNDEELKSHPAWRNFSGIRDASGLEHPPMRGWLAVPILSGNREFVGVLQLSDKNEGDFTEKDLTLLMRLASLMAPAFTLQYAHEETQRRSEELARAKEALERSNADLQQFAYVASHDLQEPLRAVAGYCQLLQKKLSDNADEDVQTFLGHATDGARRMKALIDSLLDFARLDSRRNSMELTDTGAAVEEALANLGPMIQDSGAQVNVAELPPLIADRGQLVRLFQNLIGNAIKFRGDRRPQVGVTAEEHDEHWLFSVRDNGIGIESRYADRIFVIFQRLHTRDEYPGTGLGLAISKRIVERHGGTIRMESQVGEGTTFRFTIAKRIL
jgi:signal transduction histidine kinase